MALHLPLTQRHGPCLSLIFHKLLVTTGVPPSPRATPTAANPGLSTPRVGVAVISLGTPRVLADLLSAVIPACRDCAADLLVVRRGPPVRLPEAEAAGVRFVVGPSGGDPDELRALGVAQLDADITVITSDTDPLTTDWSLLLSQVSHMVEVREGQIAPAGWGTLLGQLGAPDPADLA